MSDRPELPETIEKAITEYGLARRYVGDGSMSHHDAESFRETLVEAIREALADTRLLDRLEAALRQWPGTKARLVFSNVPHSPPHFYFDLDVIHRDAPPDSRGPTLREALNAALQEGK